MKIDIYQLRKFGNSVDPYFYRLKELFTLWGRRWDDQMTHAQPQSRKKLDLLRGYGAVSLVHPRMQQNPKLSDVPRPQDFKVV